MKQKYGFTMVEIVIAMIILIIGFFPIYNLFKHGSGAAINNIQETQATNYASDLVNFCKDLRYTTIDQHPKFNDTDSSNGVELLLEDDDKIHKFFKEELENSSLNPPPKIEDPLFKRSLKLIKYNRRGWREWFEDLFKKRKKVPSFLVEVKVTFPRNGKKGNDDDVTLYSLIMD